MWKVWKLREYNITALWNKPSSTLWLDAKEIIKDKQITDDENVVNVVFNLLAWNKLELTEWLINQVPKWVKIISHEAELFDIFQNKIKTKKFLEKKWFAVTRGFFLEVKSINEMGTEIENKIGFPVVVKETNNTWWEWIYFVNDRSELLNISFNENSEYLVEEFIEWIEYSWNLLAHTLKWQDMFNKNITIFPPTQKWETWKDDNGWLKHSLSKIRTTLMPKEIENEIRELTLKIWQIDWIDGFLEIEFILDKKDNLLKIIEVNPRYAWTNSLSLAGWKYDILELIEEMEKNPSRTNYMKSINPVVEYPLIHDNSNFEEDTFNIPAWAKVIWKRLHRKFAPFLEMYLLEFDNEENAKKFLKNNWY